MRRQERSVLAALRRVRERLSLVLSVNGKVCGLEASGSHSVTMREARHRMIQIRAWVTSESWWVSLIT